MILFMRPGSDLGELRILDGHSSFVHFSVDLYYTTSTLWL